jgi:hypothetical protein
MSSIEKVLFATLTGMTVDQFNAEAKAWIQTAKDPHWDRLYTGRCNRLKGARI